MKKDSEERKLYKEGEKGRKWKREWERENIEEEEYNYAREKELCWTQHPFWVHEWERGQLCSKIAVRMRYPY